MVEHIINVMLLPDGRIRKDALSPFEVAEGDTVRWNFDNAPGLRVEFHDYLPPSGVLPSSSAAQGLFNPPFPPATGPVAGTVAVTALRGLYIYSIFNGEGQRLQWEIPLFIAGSFVANFGGIEKPVGPP